MIRLYFKQAWQLLKQNPFYCVIYILGTGLSISMVMVLAILFYIRIANVYPETNRDRMLFVRQTIAKTNGNTGNASLSLETAKACFGDMTTTEAVSFVYTGDAETFVQPVDSKEQVPVVAKFTDAGFWQVFDFTFLHGRPYMETDVESGIFTVVISETMARKAFGTTDVVGESLVVNFEPYRVSGVVKDVSFVMERTYAMVWMPYTAWPETRYAWHAGTYQGLLGDFEAYFLAPDKASLPAVKQEILAKVNRFKYSLQGIEFSIDNQPDRQWQTFYREWGGQTINYTRILIQYILLALVLLLVPAVSLTGLTDSFMDKRMSEIGVRRSFGAPRAVLMRQLVSENLLFTLLGGGVGLLLSYLFVWSAREWIIHIGINAPFRMAVPEGVEVALSPAMLMNFTVFVVALLFCVLFNLMAVFIPAWRASRKEIVWSLNTK